MAKKSPHASDNGEMKPQIERFRETARALGADEDIEHFRDKLRVIARQKPKDDSTPTPKKRKTNGPA
jgi:hypothetical protein